MEKDSESLEKRIRWLELRTRDNAGKEMNDLVKRVKKLEAVAGIALVLAFFSFLFCLNFAYKLFIEPTLWAFFSFIARIRSVQWKQKNFILKLELISPSFENKGIKERNR